MASAESVPDTTAPRHARDKRPRAVSFVAWVLLVEAALLTLAGGLVLVLTGMAWLTQGEVELEAAYAAIPFMLGLLVLAAAVGVLYLRPWAWLLAMTVQGLSLGYALVAYSAGNPDYVTMAVGAMVVLTLNQDEVRRAFRVGHG